MEKTKIPCLANKEKHITKESSGQFKRRFVRFAHYTLLKLPLILNVSALVVKSVG